MTSRVAALLARNVSNRARLIFSFDCTASRERAWDLASRLQGDMFEQAARIGGLSVQLVHYRGPSGIESSPWFTNPAELVSAMSMIRCAAGSTRIAEVLRHIRAENERQKVDAAIFIGDSIEESPEHLYDAASGCPKLFLFQENDERVTPLDRHGVPCFEDYKPVTVESVFRRLAETTGGAYAHFDAGAAARLSELLQAVAAFAIGGTRALGDLRTDGAKKLLTQMK